MKKNIITIIIVVVSIVLGYTVAKMQDNKQITEYEKQIEVYEKYYTISEWIFIDIAQNYEYWKVDSDSKLKYSYRSEMSKQIEGFKK
jgi:uncharacterized protein YxeA